MTTRSTEIPGCKLLQLLREPEPAESLEFLAIRIQALSFTRAPREQN
ncbi:MAG: hypothetical protein JWM90_3022 [Thermoleophilia bacterium]|nr:hypothetical protein [Thermoleophilia bacterium]